ncbi:MAG: hypothetical protein P4M12_04595 [Gammaproteobacteria bacterium]|nr:hypothetical protein [Gammaproteobacteria bacterium]
MALNTTQRQTIRGALKLYVDSILERGLMSQLTNIIAPVAMTRETAVNLLRNSPAVMENVNAALNVPGSADIRSDWRRFEAAITNHRAVPADVYQRLEILPNYNPRNIATMKQLEDRLANEVNDEAARKEIIALRELYLEMTPFHEYRFRENGHVYHFRIGSVPFNLNNFGPEPTQGEIQTEVEDYINERIELEEARLEEIAELQAQIQAYEQSQVQIQEQTQALQEELEGRQLLIDQLVLANESDEEKQRNKAEIQRLQKELQELDNELVTQQYSGQMQIQELESKTKQINDIQTQMRQRTHRLEEELSMRQSHIHHLKNESDTEKKKNKAEIQRLQQEMKELDNELVSQQYAGQIQIQELESNTGKMNEMQAEMQQRTQVLEGELLMRQSLINHLENESDEEKKKNMSEIQRLKKAMESLDLELKWQKAREKLKIINLENKTKNIKTKAEEAIAVYNRTYQLAANIASIHPAHLGAMNARSASSVAASSSASSSSVSVPSSVSRSQPPISTTLFMHKQKLSGNDMAMVIEMLKRNESFDSVELQNNSIGAEGAKTLFLGLLKLSRIKSVNLWNNKLQDKGAEYIADVLSELSITDLTLNENQITHEGMSHLAPALAENTTITHIDLGYNNLGDAGISTLMVNLLERKYPLLNLKLGGNQIGVGGGMDLLCLVKTNPSIVSVELNNNSDLPVEMIEKIKQICGENFRKHLERQQDNNQQQPQLNQVAVAQELPIDIANLLECWSDFIRLNSTASSSGFFRSYSHPYLKELTNILDHPPRAASVDYLLHVQTVIALMLQPDNLNKLCESDQRRFGALLRMLEELTNTALQSRQAQIRENYFR